MKSHPLPIVSALILAFAGMALAAPVNLARNRPCKASSVEGQLTPEKAFDGPKSQGSRWGSNYGSDKNKDSAWIWVDLGTVSTVDSVAIYWEHSGSKPFAIQAWKGAGDVPTDKDSDWETIFRDSTLVYQNPPVDMCLSFHRIPATPLRFLRVRCYKRMFQFGFSIMELEVYATGPTAVRPRPQGLREPFSALRGSAWSVDGRLAPAGSTASGAFYSGPFSSFRHLRNAQ